MTDVEVSLEEAAKFLPPFLAEDELGSLYDQLKRLDAGIPYFSPNEFNFNLQGDTFARAPFVVVSANEAKMRQTTVMLLSNTCDVSEENARRLPPNVTVAPVVRVSRWCEIATDEGISAEAIDSMLESARRHRTSSMFFVPSGHGIEEDSLVLFDQIQSLPLEAFNAVNPERLATLSQAAFWLLLLKLSVHFCRQQEGVRRG